MMGMQLKPRTSFEKALEIHRCGEMTKPLRDAGWHLAEWTDGVAWELGAADGTGGYLIASEFDGIGGSLEPDPKLTGLGLDNLDCQLHYMDLSKCYLTYSYWCDMERRHEVRGVCLNVSVAEALEICAEDHALLNTRIAPAVQEDIYDI